MELYSNNISGRILIELGNLTSLVSLDLFLNNLSGIIPDTLGKLQKLRFLNALMLGPLFICEDRWFVAGSSATAAIAGGVVAGAALLFLVPAWQGWP
ncbi:unnamed protein product [Camellia sinensis]